LSCADLLLTASVCGVGIDCLPVSGATPTARLAAAIYDVAALSIRRGAKPLSCRLFLCPALRGGERTTFDSPYLCNAAAVDL